MAKLLVANWKMNPGTLAEAEQLFRETAKAVEESPGAHGNVVVCPPFDYVISLAALKAGLPLGAQDLFWETAGAYTGEVSSTMLRNEGVSYVIVGHSERRRLLNETDEMVNKKVQAALKAGLKVILCVGEPAEVRSQGLEAAEQFVRGQLERDLENVEGELAEEIIVAYEPIWAIGTGTPDDPNESAAMSRAIKATVTQRLGKAVPVLYGGSVNASNIAIFLSQQDIDGALVGGASIKPVEFTAMIKTIA